MVLTAISPSYPSYELEETKRLAAMIGIGHILAKADELEVPQYRANQGDRCYFCKTELYRVCFAKAKELGFRWVLNGANCDDLQDYRPGLRAGEEWAVRSPLVEAGLTKAEIRELSRERGLPTWDKPAMACLASRIPYGTPVTVEALSRIGEAEAYVRSLGVRQVRVRHHGDVARIETDEAGMEALLAQRRAVTERLRELGYLYVTLDLAGYRSGSLNAALGRRLVR